MKSVRNKNDWANVDAVCCVLSKIRSSELISSVLNEFLNEKEVLDFTYCDTHHEKFNSEKDMIDYFVCETTLSQLFFWNEKGKPENMIGVLFTEYGKMIISLTLQGDGETEMAMLEKLKEFVGTSSGIISYNSYPTFSSEADFEQQCRSNQPD